MPMRPAALSWCVHATVLTGGIETPYRRAGRGQPVVLLARWPMAALFEQVFRQLSRDCRVLAPRPPPVGAPEALASWLRDVMDGLGLTSPVLVVEAPFETAVRLAAAESGEAIPMTIVHRDCPASGLAALRREVRARLS
jgi:hypothetical protein